MISYFRDTTNDEFMMAGLSTDAKPTIDIPNAAIFVEIDTGKKYRLDAASGTYYEDTSGGGGGGGSSSPAYPLSNPDAPAWNTESHVYEEFSGLVLPDVPNSPTTSLEYRLVTKAWMDTETGVCNIDFIAPSNAYLCNGEMCTEVGGEMYFGELTPDNTYEFSCLVVNRGETDEGGNPIYAILVVMKDWGYVEADPGQEESGQG